MLKKSDGFSTLEATGALLLFVSVLAAVLPMTLQVYEEKQYQQYRHTAISILQQELNHWIATGRTKEATLTKGNHDYRLEWLKYTSDHRRLCIHWSLARGKQTICSDAKR
ncbi:hypothetical protein [Tuberibacillus sp. Marseille-P3662]|uniref:hypothetical protein n=1 Tax=Tuberibacillus sp. Marseille-P3662 TaxID=1965358 RepID=UPI000A1CA10D|nr:hypothetical protein [Tuberibacillus sp. Marseille-P3662]